MGERLVRAKERIRHHRLALMFACAHPAVEAGIRAPLVLQVVLGLNAKRIASALDPNQVSTRGYGTSLDGALW